MSRKRLIRKLESEMNKILTLCSTGLILLATSSGFAKSQQAVSDKQHEENCRVYMDLAHTFMEQKQKGLTLQKALEGNDFAYKQDKDMNMYKTVNMIIRDAYSQPSYSTPSIKSEQLNDFSAKYYLGCIAMYE